MKKFSPMRMTGANEEVAIAQVLSIVGASRDEVEFEVLETSAKGVTVRVKPRSENATSGNVTPIQSAPIQPQTTDFEGDETNFESDQEGFEVDETEFEVEEEDSDVEQGDFEVEEPNSEADEIEEPVFAASDEQIERARALAQSFLDKMDLEARCESLENGGDRGIALGIEGADIGILIGKQGATLQSFQYLLNLSFNNGVAPEEGIRVTVDAGNYRARRQSSLEMTARSAAQRARTSGRPVRLEPMPSSERRIIHMFLRDEKGITTQSEGREPQRRLVIFPGDSVSSESRAPRGYGAPNRGMGGFGRGGNRSGRGFRR